VVRPPEEEDKLDAAQRKLFETVCRANRWLDGLFGDEAPDASKQVTGRLELGGIYSDLRGFRLEDPDAGALAVSNMNRRLNAFIGRVEEEDVELDRPETIAMRSGFFDLEDDEEWLAGLGYSLPGSAAAQRSRRGGEAVVDARAPGARARALGVLSRRAHRPEAARGRAVAEPRWLRAHLDRRSRQRADRQPAAADERARHLRRMDRGRGMAGRLRSLPEPARRPRRALGALRHRRDRKRRCRSRIRRRIIFRQRFFIEGVHIGPCSATAGRASF
jgi:hypothetical protein